MARRGVTRREVLNLSARLFATNGYRSTSLELVSEKLGVTRQALYYHFKSKGEILGALFDEMMTKLESSAQAVANEEAGPDDASLFERMLAAYVDTTIVNADLVTLLIHERPELAKLKTLHAAKRRREFMRLLIHAYEEGVSEKKLVDADPRLVANALVSAINDLPGWYHPEAVVGSKEDVRAQLIEVFGGGFRREP